MTQKLKPIDPGSEQGKEVRSEFGRCVNMSPSEIERWLETEESKSVGQRGGPGGSTVGRDSARRIVAIKRKRLAELTGRDVAHMRKVNGYVARHLKQRPRKSGDALRETDWVRSLKNWGHDPLR
jgi:hypothetical protein